MIKPIENIARFGRLDKLAGPVAGWVQKATRNTQVQNALSGTWLGHKLHPPLTDVPLGAWLAAALLDYTKGPRAAAGARTLVGAGVLAAVPAAATGANDWSTTIGSAQRIGLVHGLTNLAATVLQGLSWVARGRGNRTGGIALSTAGLGLSCASAYLGGHLTLVQGIGVNHTAFQEPVTEWVDVAAADQVSDDRPLRVTADGVPVVLVRQQGVVYALSATCVHAGGPLDEGTVRPDGLLVCPWHQSTFRLRDGKTVRGPASESQPSWQVRTEGGRIQVRSAADG